MDTKLSSGQMFSRGLLPPSARVAAWRPRIADIVDRSPGGGSADARAERTTRWEIGALILACAPCPPARGRARRHLPPSSPDHWCLSLVRTWQPADAQVSQGDRLPRLSLRPLGPPLDGDAQGDEVLTLFLPRASLPQLERAWSTAFDVDIAAGMQRLLADYLIGLARHLPHMTREQACVLAAPTIALVGACALPSSLPGEAATTLPSTTLIERAADVVGLNMAFPDFGPDQLCQLLAISRSKLYRHFRTFGGVGAFIQQERLREALVRLADQSTVRAVRRIAEDVGFCDHSTFSRAFRRAFGFRPSEARERVLAEPSLLTNPSYRRTGCISGAHDGPARA